MTRCFQILAIALLASTCPIPGRAAPPARIVSAAGSLTEIIFALGENARLAGVDTTSQFPAEAKKLPQVGYQRTLSAEGVLSLKPDLVVATTDAGPPAVLQQLRDAGVRILTVPEEHSCDGVKRKIRALAEVLEVPGKGETLIAKFQTEIDSLAAVTNAPTKSPPVLFLLGAGQGAPLAAGTKTAADSMIALAGGRNVITAYSGYKPLGIESAVAAAPDFILTTTRTLEGCGGTDGLLKVPGLAETPAGKTRRVIAMDDLYLLGFGPRTALAAAELAAQLKTEIHAAQR